MENKIKIAVVDDERIIRVTLGDDLRDNGFDVREFSNAEAVLGSLHEYRPDIIVTDLKMQGIDGLELLSKIKKTNPEITVIVMTAFGTVDNAVEAMKNGAYDYITKPFKLDEILLIIERINELNLVKKENKILRGHIEGKYDLSAYIGENETNKELFDLIKLVAEKDTTVLITGETGTGKEHVTNIIHYNSARKKQPLVKVSCAILSREIIESELFGHVKGAFTGAEQDKKGRFELANNGTLYLDDVDDIPLDLQVKLLRVLQEKEIERVGSATSIKINIRLIASTKKNLSQMVKDGKFREDLFYRLNIFPIILQPLRERKKDIRKLLQHFINKYAQGKEILIEDEVVKLLNDYSWPGNVRELKNISERLVILASDGKIELQHIPSEVRNQKFVDLCSIIGTKKLEQTLSEVEILFIKLALEKNKNNKSKAAEMLGIPLSTLRSKMEKHSIVI